MMAFIKWLHKRLFFLKKDVYGMFDVLFYQKQSRFLRHFWHAKTCPIEPVLFYSFLGRVVFGARELIALLSGGKIFSKRIQLDGFDVLTKEQEIFAKGSNKHLWPQSPFFTAHQEVDDAFIQKIEASYVLAAREYHDDLDKTEDWEMISQTFKRLLLDDEKHLKKETLVHFRHNHSFENIIADTFKQVDTQSRYIEAYLKAIDLVMEYHRSAKKVSKEILASLSESYAGDSACVHYRGLRLSEKLLFYALATDDIVKHVPFTAHRRSVYVDIGTGYGGLPSILKNYVPNSCFVLVDLPEVLVFAAYYLRYNFPHKKIALLEDVQQATDMKVLYENYDFILIPPQAMSTLPSMSVDLVSNTASMGFLSKEYLQYYMQEINRILKIGGYFYSINKTHTCKWGVGMYALDFQKEYVTILLEYNNRFSYPQWLGKKVN